MTNQTDADKAAAMRNAIDMIEEAYEFMLAYAAQGRKHDADDGGVSKIRDYMNRFSEALGEMEGAAEAVMAGEAASAFRARFLDDLAVMRSVIALVLEKPSISSDMVDNTNGLIAVRAFLTDLLFIDQTVLPPR